tara:strand:- start:203 stop:382 length:180 start_codon:yes stop_codon:yes gene_type:complete
MGGLIMSTTNTRKQEFLDWLLDVSKEEPDLISTIFTEYVNLMESNDKLDELEDFLVNNF